MKQYLDLMQHILDNGVRKEDRTGTGTISVFGYQMRFNLAEGFPAVTTKKLHFRSIIHELLWFLQGSTNIQYLHDNRVTIWDEWADEKGDLGPVYGYQWRSWPTPNGFYRPDLPNHQQPEKQSRFTPPHRQRLERGRRRQHGATSLPFTLPILCGGGQTLLPTLPTQCRRLLGRPLQYHLLRPADHDGGSVTGLKLGDFVHTFGDAHLYLNHLDQAKLQLSREPYPLPHMQLNPDVTSIFDFQYKDFKLVDYQSHLTIKAPIAV